MIQDGYPWTEQRTISVCGDQTYEIKRKSGVLVEISLDDLPKTGQPNHLRGPVKIRGKKVYLVSPDAPYPHSEVITRDRKKFIRLITSRKAIFSSWGEYELEIARRDKERQDEQDRMNRLRNPQAALMGLSLDEFRNRYINFYARRNGGEGVYLGAEWHEVYETAEDGHYARDEHGHKIKLADIGTITITLDQAEKILSLLTPKQKKALTQ